MSSRLAPKSRIFSSTDLSVISTRPSRAFLSSASAMVSSEEPELGVDLHPAVVLLDRLHRGRQLLGTEPAEFPHIEEDGTLVQQVDVIDVLEDGDDAVDARQLVLGLDFAADLVQHADHSFGARFFLQEDVLAGDRSMVFDDALLVHRQSLGIIEADAASDALALLLGPDDEPILGDDVEV